MRLSADAQGRCGPPNARDRAGTLRGLVFCWALSTKPPSCTTRDKSRRDLAGLGDRVVGSMRPLTLDVSTLSSMTFAGRLLSPCGGSRHGHSSAARIAVSFRIPVFMSFPFVLPIAARPRSVSAHARSWSLWGFVP